jgi:glycolate oxidase FAD binding subunit
MPSDHFSGSPHVTPSDILIDGQSIPLIVEPDSPAEIADALAEADRQGWGVAPLGGGSSLSLGNRPERIDLGISTNRLRGVIEYEPTDLTMSVAAGSRFADVQAVLGEHGQQLPIEVPDPENATIGGLIATAIAGPKRYGAGTLRDLLIGISAAHPSGTVTKAGGMVVKNVTGFDLMRLYLGSLGTLGVIVSANFKVLPVARAEATVIAELCDPSAAFQAAERVRSSRVNPLAIEVERMPGGSWSLAVRIEGRDATVRLLAGEAVSLVAADTSVVEGQASQGWWRRYLVKQDLRPVARRVLVRLTVRPVETEQAVAGALKLAEGATVSLVGVQASPGLGTALLTIEAAGGSIAAFRDALYSVADHVAVLTADPALKADLDVWGTPPVNIDVMRAIKEQFDPNRVLNPGRFAARL